MYRIVFFFSLLTAFLSGCTGYQREQAVTAGAKAVSANIKTSALQQEVDALLAQPYIDPITRYLQRYEHEASHSSYLQILAEEQQRRCQAVAKRYQQQPKTPDVLKAYRAGYRFSCPEEVEHFSRQILQTQFSDCYLLTDLRNFSDALAPCEEAALAGDPRGQLNMALISKAQRNYEEARHWAQTAAQAFPEADLLLGELHADGLGGAKNLTVAKQHFTLAAEQGVVLAQIALGLLYLYEGDEVHDPLLAKSWLLRAARQGSARAQYYLGEMCEKGLAGSKDLYEALVWFDFASLNGSREARAKLASLSQKAVDLTQLSLAQTRIRRQLQELN